jgi:hypothetical protein
MSVTFNGESFSVDTLDAILESPDCYKFARLSDAEKADFLAGRVQFSTPPQKSSQKSPQRPTRKPGEVSIGGLEHFAIAKLFAKLNEIKFNGGFAAYNLLDEQGKCDVIAERKNLEYPVDPSLPPGCPSKQYLGTGGTTECDGCCTSIVSIARMEGMSVEEVSSNNMLRVCPRCHYASCENCTVHHSKGTCYCKESNYGHAYAENVEDRPWYQSGIW